MTVDTYLSSPNISHQAASYDSQAFLSPIDKPAPPQTLPPLVLVEGFFSFFHKRLWGAFETHLNAARAAAGLPGRRRVILSRGTVDYGEDHARESGHARYGRHYPTGLYPSWSKQYPIHFVTHSLGGTTVTVMQSLIKSGHFGSSAHPDMVASLAAVSAPFKGTPFVFWIGEDKKSAPDIKFFSINSFMTKAIHTLCYLAPIIPSFIPLPDLFYDARKMTMRQLSFLQYLKVMWRSSWGQTKDVISFDCTFEAADIREANWDDPGLTHSTEPMLLA
ncbi:hypothetical protein BS47DRAFT_1067131 [Hydnum rufescens UP504]|uniref:Lipase-like C-terminal domain-containing protein n=1 Tax=Hydnum rufescens UP504 TaxID=1448309 RepID=A0A9P6AVD1_9AGAM|nr:hypothetical protein BS47DRAFT_1067131 [Hydnum rufescens UP504]